MSGVILIFSINWGTSFMKNRSIRIKRSFSASTPQLQSIWQRANHAKQNNVAFPLTYSEVTGKPATLEEMNAILRDIDINAILGIIAALNNRYCMDTAVSHQEMHHRQAELVHDLFSPELQQQIFASPFGRSSRQVLFLQAATTFCLAPCTSGLSESGWPYIQSTH